MRLFARGRSRATRAHEAGTHTHADGEAFHEAVDPGYWPRAMGLRLVIAVCYIVLVPAGVLPMSHLWYAASGGTLLLYSVAMYIILLRYGVLRLHDRIGAYLDTVVVTLAIVALARPEYPIWMGYFLVIPTLGNFHGSRYVLGFSVWSIVNCWAAFLILGLTGRADTDWQLVTVISFMAVFTALNADIISQSNRKLRALVRDASLTDPLTGLANRRRFRQVLESHERIDMRPLAVLMYDIDNFKRLNEEHGHVHADGVLVRIAAQLRESFRDADTIARYGGDELIVLAHTTTVDGALNMAERSIQRIRERTGVTMSVGVSVYPLMARTLDGAVHGADEALGRAKRGGKSRAALAWDEAA